MSTNKQIEKILYKPMTRKQFLQHVGLVILSILGVNALISRLMHPEKHLAAAHTEESRGWGNGKFGV